jgi:hypothetical protein
LAGTSWRDSGSVRRLLDRIRPQPLTGQCILFERGGRLARDSSRSVDFQSLALRRSHTLARIRNRPDFQISAVRFGIERR